MPTAPIPTPGSADVAAFRPELAEAILRTTAALVVVLTPAGQVVHFNAACERLTGHPAAEVEGQVLWPFVLDDDEARRAVASFANLTPGQFVRRYENCWRTRSGDTRQILWSNTELLTPEGRTDLIVATGLDVTEERRAQQARLESDARFQALFDACADGVVIIDPHDLTVPWRIVDCNDAFCAMNGYARHDLVGHSIDLLHEDGLMANRGPELLDWIRAQGYAHGEGQHRHRGGHTFPIESSSSVVTVGGQELVLGLDRDITGRKAAEARQRSLTEQLAHAAHHDALTGLPNRALLEDRLTLELARAARSGKGPAVLFIDLDDFKRVNDALGHAGGDAVLREVAARLRRAVRPSDTVARLGGDEFVVLLPEVDFPHLAARVVQRIQQALGTPIALGSQAVSIAASVGISLHGQGTGSAEDLLRQADLAMYQIKKEGKNAVRFFTEELDVAARQRLHLEERLRQALSDDCLTLHYQPQFSVAHGHLIGLEALARWTDVELGVVPPGTFIALAEDNGLIVALGAWVLDEACRQSAEWQLSVPIAVNVSPLQLLRPDFVGAVQTTLKRHGLRGSALKLELTERLSLHDQAAATPRLHQLRALGVQLSLDDFGAGQAALASVLGLPITELKLDRGLISTLNADPATWQIVEALLALARSLNVPVVAEGVETPEQLGALRALGCAHVQGYLTGRPDVPAALRTVVDAAR